MAVLDFAHLGSSLAVRSFVRLGEASGAGARVTGDVSGQYHDPLLGLCSSQLCFYDVNSASRMTVEYDGSNAGGTLHGTWTAQSMISVSDERLKSNIRPLFATLKETALAIGGSGRQWSPAAVLERLRPVSYHLKTAVGSERFGFIADEVEQALPQTVYRLHGGGSAQGVQYNDLLAVLVSAMQGMSNEMESLQPRLASVEARIRARRAWRAARRARRSEAARPASAQPRRGGLTTGAGGA